VWSVIFASSSFYFLSSAHSYALLTPPHTHPHTHTHSHTHALTPSPTPTHTHTHARTQHAQEQVFSDDEGAFGGSSEREAAEENARKRADQLKTERSKESQRLTECEKSLTLGDYKLAVHVVEACKLKSADTAR
jgi:hypothetical protein